MPAPAKGPRLGGGPAHERLILANLATQLFEHGRITTTVTKAKRVQPLAERMITFAKRGDLHARRRVLRVVRDKAVVHELFTEIGPSMAEREGGYTRITKIGNRKGDNAPMAVIELVREPVSPKQAVVREATAATKRAAAPAAAEPAKAADSVVSTGSTTESAAKNLADEELVVTDGVVTADGETPAKNLADEELVVTDGVVTTEVETAQPVAEAVTDETK